MVATLQSVSGLAVLAFVVAGFALGGPDPRTRSVLALGTGQRNIAAALVIATQNFTDTGVVTMLLVTTFGGLFVLLAAGHVLVRRANAMLTRCGLSMPVVGRE